VYIINTAFWLVHGDVTDVYRGQHVALLRPWLYINAHIRQSS